MQNINSKKNVISSRFIPILFRINFPLNVFLAQGQLYRIGCETYSYDKQCAFDFILNIQTK